MNKIIIIFERGSVQEERVIEIEDRIHAGQLFTLLTSLMQLFHLALRK